MINISTKDFYKKYSEEEKNYIKSELEKANEISNDKADLQKYSDYLSNKKFNKYPEVQFYRVNALIKLGKLNKALNLALNYYKFEPLSIIAKELSDRLEEYNPLIDNTKNKIVDSFISIYSEVDRDTAYLEVKALNYDDTMELNKLLKQILEIEDSNSRLDILKRPGLDRYSFLLYIRIKEMFNTNSNTKASKILKVHENRALFKPLLSYITIDDNNSNEQNQTIKSVEIEDINTKQEDKLSDINKELSILLTKLYVDNLTIEEIDNSIISDFDKEIFKLAYYEKYNKKYGEKYIKGCIRKYKELDDLDKVKVLNVILSHYNKKHHGLMFDIGIYQTIFECEILSYELDKYRSKEDSNLVLIKKI